MLFHDIQASHLNALLDTSSSALCLRSATTTPSAQAAALTGVPTAGTAEGGLPSLRPTLQESSDEVLPSPLGTPRIVRSGVVVDEGPEVRTELRRCYRRRRDLAEEESLPRVELLSPALEGVGLLAGGAARGASVSAAGHAESC